MASIKDDQGHNQGFKPSRTMSIRNERRCDYIVSNINVRKGTQILEIGCGTGHITYMLAKKSGAEVLGIDICKPFIEQARKSYKLPNLKFELMDFNNPDKVKGRKFDYIVGNGILHHLYHNLDETLLRIKSLLNEEGKLVFMEPNLLNPYGFFLFSLPSFRKWARLDPGEMAFTKRFITKKLRKAGFSDIKVEYKDFLAPQTPFALVKPVVKVGAVIEKTPLLKTCAQSLFISARKR